MERLCERFDKDMQFDVHRLTIKVGRSEAAKELRNRGRASLAAIARHLRQHPNLNAIDVREGWGELLGIFEFEIDRERLSGPDKALDTEGWIAWAERMSA